MSRQMTCQLRGRIGCSRPLYCKGFFMIEQISQLRMDPAIGSMMANILPTRHMNMMVKIIGRMMSALAMFLTTPLSDLLGVGLNVFDLIILTVLNVCVRM